MAAYGMTEARIHANRKPDTKVCVQCEDTGFVMTAWGLRGCPLCSEEETHGEHSSDAGV